MKKDLLLRICAAVMSAICVFSAVTACQIIRAYADEDTAVTEAVEETQNAAAEEVTAEPVYFDAAPAPEPVYEEPVPEPVYEEQVHEQPVYEQPAEEQPAFPEDPSSPEILTPLPAPVYATEENYSVPYEPAPIEEVIIDPQPDPFDYNLITYTDSISFGQLTVGDYPASKQFSIVNVGSTAFPLTWDVIDEKGAFSLQLVAGTTDTTPGSTVTFAVTPETNLPAGSYTASYIFYSANDYRRHHKAVVNVSVTVSAPVPTVSYVDVTPGSAVVPAGKSYQFNVSVGGSLNFDPTVTWSIIGQQSSGTYIDSEGRLNVSPYETAASLGVIATSRQNPAVADKAVVTIASVDHMVTVRSDPAGAGAVAGGGAVRSGNACSITASPNNNYEFTGWYEGKTLLSKSKKLTIDSITSDRTFTAKFSRKSCYVRTSVSDADAGTVTGGGSVGYGGSMTLTAKPKSGYSFVGFTENNKTISTAASLELGNITTDRDIRAVFQKEVIGVYVSVYPQGAGKCEGGGKYNRNSNVTLKAAAADGYVFTCWTINGQIVSDKTTYTIQQVRGDVSVTANFSPKNTRTFKIASAAASAGGGITPSGEYAVPEGGSVTYYIVPQPGYRVAALAVDGKNITPAESYTFSNVREAHTIAASFTLLSAAPAQTPAAAPAQAPAQQAVPAQQTAPVQQALPAQQTVPAQQASPAQQTAPAQQASAAQPAEPQQAVPAQQYAPVSEDAADESFPADAYVPEQTSSASAAQPGGIMAKHDLNEETLRRLIRDNSALPLLYEAFQDGTLQITVNNSYAVDPQETAHGTYYREPTLVNFEEFVIKDLTDEEKYAVLTGRPISYNVDLTDISSDVNHSIVRAMQKKVGYKPVSYFDFSIIKTFDGSSRLITSSETELEVIIPIPSRYLKEGRRFCVIRDHGGSVEVLTDIGSDSSSVVFRTNKFSSYAIAYEAININNLVLRFAIVTVLSLIMALTCFVALIRYRRKQRLAERRKKKEPADMQDFTEDDL